MVNPLYSRKLLILVLLGIYATSFYIVYNFDFTTIVYGTVILVTLLAYIGVYAVKHIDVRDSVSALVFSAIFLVLGLLSGLVFSSNVLGAVLYILSFIIAFIGLIYAVTKYVL